jgi:membrane carboxypeptidase/penicillin-binding protein
MAVWFNGYTPTLATAAMIAGANQEGHWITLNGQQVGGTYIDVAHGSTVAGPMWASAMRAVQDDLPDEDFVPPGLDTEEGQIDVEVPDVTGVSSRRAAQRLAAAGFYVSMGERLSSDEPQGTVAETSPEAGEGAPRGSTVTVHPSKGD